MTQLPEINAGDLIRFYFRESGEENTVFRNAAEERQGFSRFADLLCALLLVLEESESPFSFERIGSLFRNAGLHRVFRQYLMAVAGLPCDCVSFLCQGDQVICTHGDISVFPTLFYIFFSSWPQRKTGCLYASASRPFGGKVVYHSGWLRPIDIMHQAASSASSSVRFSSQNSVITFLIISSSASTGKPAASQ